MPEARTALYLDFDNVFGGLLKLDPEAAIRFAEDPASWLARLSTSLTITGPRRWLVLRCYMNPGGSVPHPDPAAGVERLYFSTFRPFFTQAGFEVVDCPRLTHTKNAADIRLVLDAVTDLGAVATYDEFVIASGDSDMTPLLVRLRAADRRTTIVSPSDAAVAFTAVADQLINGQQVLALVQGEAVETDEDAEADSPGVGVDGSGPEPAQSQASASSVDSASTDLTAVDGTTLPEPVARLRALLGLPRLPLAAWPHIYRVLADYARSHHFNLTEATRWSRDQLHEQEVNVSRSAVGFVLRGTAHGGCPVYRQPPPSAADIASAFVANVLSRAEAATIELTDEEVKEVRSWLGDPET